MAEENSKTFGNGKMDCCDLNRSNNAVKKQNNSGKQPKRGGGFG